MARGRGRPRAGGGFTEAVLIEAIMMQEEGMTHLAIAKALGFSDSTVRKHLGPSRHPSGRLLVGGEWRSDKGYVIVSPLEIKERHFPTTRKTGVIARSHLVWNRHHPDDLVQPGDHVHHINRVTDDDRIENLEKLTPEAHDAEHQEERSERMRAANLERSKDPAWHRELSERMIRRRAEGRIPSKLTAEQVIAIQARFAAGGATKAALAREYGVSDVQIGRIVRGERWNEEAAAARRLVQESATPATEPKTDRGDFRSLSERSEPSAARRKVAVGPRSTSVARPRKSVPTI